MVQLFSVLWDFTNQLLLRNCSPFRLIYSSIKNVIMTKNICPLESSDASPQQAALQQKIEGVFGSAPNIFTTMLHSAVATESYLQTTQLLAKGKLGPKLRESIALVVGETNSCEYCVSAHTLLGSNAGLNEEEVISARRGEAEQPRAKAILQFAKKVVSERGHVTTNDIDTLRSHDVSDEELVEIIAHVGMNIFTNYFNHIAGTEIDFPRVEKLSSCTCS